MEQIEAEGARMWRAGTVDRWFAGASSDTRGVVRNVNGPLFAKLASQIEHHDAKCVELFRDGGALSGQLTRSIVV